MEYFEVEMNLGLRVMRCSETDDKIQSTLETGERYARLGTYKGLSYGWGSYGILSVGYNFNKEGKMQTFTAKEIMDIYPLLIYQSKLSKP